MASSLLRSTSDFLETGIDECLRQLHNCADMPTPDSSCSSPSDCSRLSWNTRLSFERRSALDWQPYCWHDCHINSRLIESISHFVKSWKLIYFFNLTQTSFYNCVAIVVLEYYTRTFIDAIMKLSTHTLNHWLTDITSLLLITVVTILHSVKHGQ